MKLCLIACLNSCQLNLSGFHCASCHPCLRSFNLRKVGQLVLAKVKALTALCLVLLSNLLRCLSALALPSAY